MSEPELYEEAEWAGEATGPYRPCFDFSDDGRYALAVSVRGPCPRCHHETEDGHPLYRSDGFLALRRGSAAYRQHLKDLVQYLRAGDLEPVGDTRADLLCRCAEPHPGQPGPGTGCGTSWSLSVRVPPQ